MKQAMIYVFTVVTICPVCHLLFPACWTDTFDSHMVLAKMMLVAYVNHISLLTACLASCKLFGLHL